MTRVEGRGGQHADGQDAVIRKNADAGGATVDSANHVGARLARKVQSMDLQP